jgi:hypothetical protein
MLPLLPVGLALAAGVARPEWCELKPPATEQMSLYPVGADGLLVIGSDKRGKRYRFTRYDTSLAQV